MNICLSCFFSPEKYRNFAVSKVFKAIYYFIQHKITVKLFLLCCIVKNYWTLSVVCNCPMKKVRLKSSRKKINIFSLYVHGILFDLLFSTSSLFQLCHNAVFSKFGVISSNIPQPCSKKIEAPYCVLGVHQPLGGIGGVARKQIAFRQSNNNFKIVIF